MYRSYDDISFVRLQIDFYLTLAFLHSADEYEIYGICGMKGIWNIWMVYQPDT